MKYSLNNPIVTWCNWWGHTNSPDFVSENKTENKKIMKINIADFISEEASTMLMTLKDDFVFFYGDMDQCLLLIWYD